MCHDGYAARAGNVRRRHNNAQNAQYADNKGDEHAPTQSEIEHRSPLFDDLSAQIAPFRRVVAMSSTLATVSGRLHRGPKVVSSRAELIHRNMGCVCRDCLTMSDREGKADIPPQGRDFRF
jgi:hypothetical protein